MNTIVQAPTMAIAKVQEASHGSVEMGHHLDGKIESSRFQDPQDDEILISRTGKRPVLKVGHLHSISSENMI